jgi:bifunctional UDP-N-acetylglucosamine pyrophosphorylase/glucosamine-1-phosphate N-acetyltransferase
VPEGPLTVVVLAAGEGTRMRSATPKVLHPLAGRTMLGHVLAAAQPLHADTTLVVVGHGRDQVIKTLPDSARPVVQERQGGTGHAVRTALEAADITDGTVVVIPGDAPLLTAASLHALTDLGSALLTTTMTDPTGYGRVVRAGDGTVLGIVEERDCTDRQRAICEVAVSTYAFRAADLREVLATIGSANAAGEEYLTDVVAALSHRGLAMAAVAADPTEVIGVNDRVQLAAAGRALNDRLIETAMRAGVTVTDPASTWLDVSVTYEPDAVLRQNTRLHGSTHLGAGCDIGPDTTLTDTRIEAYAHVCNSVVTGSDIGERATVGPYAHLRNGTVLGPGAKVGAFAETKSAVLGAGAKIPHLAYVGDATVGARANIGCGTVVANYDGVDKHRTTIGADAKIGSNTTLVAPVTVGDGAYTGADAVIRQDVPAGALAYSENRQVTREGWARDNRRVPPRETSSPTTDATEQDSAEGTA